MIEIAGLVFGGLSRLGQYWMELRERDKERAHEAVMFDKQVALSDREYMQQRDMKHMDNLAAESTAEWNALAAAVQAQAEEAKAAGGWVAKFSASMRPFLTFYHAVLLFTLYKLAMFYIATAGGLEWAHAFTTIYDDFDRALVGSMVGFWFQDRSLRRKGF